MGMGNGPDIDPRQGPDPGHQARPVLCFPELGLHTVARGSGIEIRHMPVSARVLIQRCSACGVTLNEVSLHTGVMLAPGSQVITHPDPGINIKIQIPTDLATSVAVKPMAEARALLARTVWAHPVLEPLPDMSRHPSVLGNPASSPASSPASNPAGG